MKRKYIVGLSMLFFILVIVFTNDKVKEQFPYSEAILIVSFLGLIACVIASFLFNSTNKIDRNDKGRLTSNLPIIPSRINQEYVEIKDKDSSIIFGKRSILVSLIMLFYTFIFIGSNINTDNTFILVLMDTTRFVAIVLGIYIFFLNAYMAILQIKLNRNLLSFISIFILLFSLSYFIFVSFLSLIEMLK